MAITLLSVLLALAAPQYRLWVRNAQVRTVTDALQAGMRMAQAEAVRRNRQVVFFLTNSQTCDNTISANANGTFWSIRTVAMVTGDPVETVQCGVLADVAGGVTIEGPTAVCFNGMGRQVSNASTGVTSATCDLTGVTVSQFDVEADGADRALRVLVSLGGQTRLCDPARTLATGALDGCP